MTALLWAAIGGYGVHLVVTAVLYRWSGLGISPRDRGGRTTVAQRAQHWMSQAGLGDVRPAEMVGACALLAVAGGAIGATVFGAFLPAIGTAALAGTTPVGAYRHRRATRLAAAHDAWPHLIEEMRVLIGAAGRSIPQALLDVGRRGPDELRVAFEVAHREWTLSHDFDRCVRHLRTHLADPTADAVCETLLIAHEVGGADLDRRLGELAEDRRIDNLARKDARAKQAGVRFARRFVVAVPAGMAVAGMSLGDGRDAYRTATGQTLVAVGLSLTAACWVWSGRLLRLPTADRVLA